MAAEIKDWRIGVRVKPKYAPPRLRSDGPFYELPHGEIIDVVWYGRDDRIVIRLDDGRQEIDDPDNWVTE